MELEATIQSVGRCPHIVICSYHPVIDGRRQEHILFSELYAGFVLHPIPNYAKFQKLQQILTQLAQRPGNEVIKFLKPVPLPSKHTEVIATAFWLFVTERLSPECSTGLEFHQSVVRLLANINAVIGVLEPVCKLEPLKNRSIMAMWLAPQVQKSQLVLLAPESVRKTIHPPPIPLRGLSAIFQLPHVPTTSIVPVVPHQAFENVGFQLGLADNHQAVGLSTNWQAPLLIVGGSLKERIRLTSYFILECFQQSPPIPHVFAIDVQSVFNGLVHTLSKNEVREWRLGYNLSLDLSHMPDCENSPTERASWLARLLYGSVSETHFQRHQHTFEERVRTLDPQTTFLEMYDQFVARDADQRYTYAEIRSLLSAFLAPHHHITSPPLGEVVRGAPITILQPGNQPETVRRYFQLYWLTWLVAQAPPGSVIVLDQVEGLVPSQRGQALQGAAYLIDELILEANRRNLRLVFLSSTYWLAPTILKSMENRIYLHLARKEEQDAVLATHALHDPAVRQTLQAGRQALFIPEEAPNYALFFEPATIHPAFGSVQFQTVLNPLDQMIIPRRERIFRPQEYAVVMTVLEEAMQHPHLSENRFQQLLALLAEPDADVLHWASFIDSLGFIEARQMGGIHNFVITEIGREYFTQQMAKIRVWPAPLSGSELQTVLNEFGDHIDRLSVPLSTEDQDILTELGQQLLSSAYHILEKYPWALIQQFYSGLLHPSPQGFVDWYSTYLMLGIHRSEDTKSQFSSEIPSSATESYPDAETAFEALLDPLPDETEGRDSPSSPTDIPTTGAAPPSPSLNSNPLPHLPPSNPIPPPPRSQTDFEAVFRRVEPQSPLLRFLQKSASSSSDESENKEETQDSSAKLPLPPDLPSMDDPFAVAPFSDEEGDDE